MSRRNIVLITAGAVLIVAALVLAIVLNASAAPERASAGPDPISMAPTPDPTSTSTPAPPSDETPAPTAIDPYYGDTVVAAPADSSAGEFPSGLSVEVASADRTTVTGAGPGSTSGAALVVTLRLTNTSAQPADVAATITAYSGDDRVPLSPVDGGSKDTGFSETLASGATETGTFWFLLDPADPPVRVAVSVGPDSGLVVLELR